MYSAASLALRVTFSVSYDSCGTYSVLSRIPSVVTLYSAFEVTVLFTLFRVNLQFTLLIDYFTLHYVILYFP